MVPRLPWKEIVMAQAAPAQRAIAVDTDPAGAIAAGGPIAELQRTIEERMMTTEWHAGSTSYSEGGFPHLVSRAAGPALLAVAYGAVALWWF